MIIIKNPPEFLRADNFSRLFSGNTFYHKKGKVLYHFGKSCENRDFIKLSVRTTKNTNFSVLLSLKSLFQRYFARFRA